MNNKDLLKEFTKMGLNLVLCTSGASLATFGKLVNDNPMAFAANPEGSKESIKNTGRALFVGGSLLMVGATISIGNAFIRSYERLYE